MMRQNPRAVGNCILHIRLPTYHLSFGLTRHSEVTSKIIKIK